MDKQEILDIFNKTGAMLSGHFELSSGLHSATYLQCAKMLQYPTYAASLCGDLAQKFEKDKPNIVIAPAVGGIIVSYEIARILGAKSLFSERVKGEMKLRRGFELTASDKVLIVEDVVTTGLSTKEVVGLVKSYNADIVGVGCLIDRSEKKIDFGARFESLMKISASAFKPLNCPLCKQNTPITKPGSRSTATA